MLAAPTSTVAALGRAARSGILVKGGQYLERVASVKAVLFDKTDIWSFLAFHFEDYQYLPVALFETST